MGLKELGKALDGWRVDILATDLSTEVIDRAKAGIYSQFEVQRGLPIHLPGEVFHASRRDLADRSGTARDGEIPAAQSAARFLPRSARSTSCSAATC